MSAVTQLPADQLKVGDRFFHEGRRYTASGPISDLTRGWILHVRHAGEIWVPRGTTVGVYHFGNKETIAMANAKTAESPTDAYLARMARRDDPNDYGVCEHNIDLAEEPCLDGCSPTGPRIHA